MKSNFSDDIWDEHKWESHINQAEQKSEEIRDFLDKTFGEEGPRWVKILKESESEYEALDTYIEEELMFDEAYFPDDDDDWDDDDIDDDIFLIDHLDLRDEGKSGPDEDDSPEDQDPLNFDDDDDSDMLDEDDLDDLDIEEGEEWKLLSDDFTLSDSGSIDNLEVYRNAHDFGAHILVRSADVFIDDPDFRDLFNLFVSDVLHISAKIAAGYSLGFEADMLGGNIAYCKKGLQAANRALTYLKLLKEHEIEFGDFEYKQLHADLFHIRNDLGIYVQELREMFEEEL